ncbi:MAG: polymer-forming cytoskeletal protein [Bacteroidia bacterium]|nr:polymer-forming cytoskeletal protein [Bacteroidia bacterium]
MFGSNKKEESVPTQVATSKSSKGLNSLVAGTTVEGNINADNDFRIDGTLIGNLNGKSKVIIGPEGKVKGEVICANAIIEGSFDGSMNVSKQLNIKSSAKVQGTIHTADLVVESGAKFNVKCVMGKDYKQAVQSSTNGAKKVVSTT